MEQKIQVPEYQKLMEQAPQIHASGLEGDYRRLAEFNNVVLAGHKTRFGMEFVTWEWVHNKTALWQGHYYGVGDSGGYQSAKRDFAVRSGLLPASALFTPEQLTEVYRSIHETLDGEYPLTDERRKLLESAAGQIEDFVPELDERVQRSNQAELDAPRGGGMELS